VLRKAVATHHEATMQTLREQCAKIEPPIDKPVEQVRQAYEAQRAASDEAKTTKKEKTKDHGAEQ